MEEKLKNMENTMQDTLMTFEGYVDLQRRSDDVFVLESWHENIYARDIVHKILNSRSTKEYSFNPNKVSIL